MATITLSEYKRYCRACEDSCCPLPLQDVKDFLSGLVGKTLQSVDGCYTYEIVKGGVKHDGEKLGKSIFDGLIGWLCKIEHVVDLMEELDWDGDYDRALWVVGFGDTDITNPEIVDA